MKRTEPQPLRVVLEEAVRQADMENELLRQRAIALWPRLVGEAIANACGKPFFRGQTMHIAVHKAPLRHELSMMRSSMIKAINDALKATVVDEIRFIGTNKP